MSAPNRMSGLLYPVYTLHDWACRVQLIDGSPQWEVYRNVSMPAMPEKGSALSQPAREPSQQTQSGLILPDSAQSLVSYRPQLKHSTYLYDESTC